jgi:hypothetical protein
MREAFEALWYEVNGKSAPLTTENIFKLYRAALSQPAAVEGLICPRCEVDHAKESCPGGTGNCPMHGNTASPTQPQEQEAVEPVATILPSDPYDERDGLWLSLEDRKRLSQLPAGTKIFTFSPTAQQALRMAADVVLKPMDDPQMTVLERDIRAEILGKILALAPTAPAQQNELQPLMKFYAVSTVEELAKAQAAHIEKLQAKLPSMPDQFPPSYRKG